MNYVEELDEILRKLALKTLEYDDRFDDEKEEKEKILIESRAYADARKRYLDHFADYITVGEIYYVINYKNGDKSKPIIEKMKLYKTSGEKKISYYFTYLLNRNEWLMLKKPDLILSKSHLSKRVFPSYSLAKQKAGL